MPRGQRVSNGEIPGYGKQVYDTLAVDAAWRTRISSEGVGFRKTDESGSNASISMLWCPVAQRDTDGKTSKRPSDIKALLDAAMVPARPLPQASAPAPATPVPPPSASQCSLSSRVSDRMSIITTQLHSEDPRLQALRTHPHTCPPRSTASRGVGACSQAATRERALGQTYLRVGNLVEARKHLARAERLLEIETPKMMDAATAAALKHVRKPSLVGSAELGDSGAAF